MEICRVFLQVFNSLLKPHVSQKHLEGRERIMGTERKKNLTIHRESDRVLRKLSSVSVVEQNYT